MPRARRLPARDRRRLIIEAAQEVFATQSYAKVGIADLAKACGISEPALYRYFASKKDLFLAVIRSTGPRLLDIWQNIAYEVDDPLETLASIGVHYYDHLQRHSANMKLQFQAVSEADDDDIRSAVRGNFDSYVQFVADTLDEGKRRGIVRPDIDSRLIAWQFLGIGLNLDLMHLMGFTNELDRGKVELWGRLYLDALRVRRKTAGIGPGVRAVSELATPHGWPAEIL